MCVLRVIAVYVGIQSVVAFVIISFLLRSDANDVSNSPVQFVRIYRLFAATVCLNNRKTSTRKFLFVELQNINCADIFVCARY